MRNVGRGTLGTEEWVAFELAAARPIGPEYAAPELLKRISRQ